MPDEPSAWVKGAPLEFEPRCDCGCAYPNDRRESSQSMTPTPAQIALAKRVPYSVRYIAEAIAEAEVRGFKAGVEAAARHLRATAVAAHGKDGGLLAAAASRIEGITPNV